MKRKLSDKPATITFEVYMGYSSFSVEATERGDARGFNRKWLSAITVDAHGDWAYLECCVREYVHSLAYFTNPAIIIRANSLSEAHGTFPECAML